MELVQQRIGRFAQRLAAPLLPRADEGDVGVAGLDLAEQPRFGVAPDGRDVTGTRILLISRGPGGGGGHRREAGLLLRECVGLARQIQPQGQPRQARGLGPSGFLDQPSQQDLAIGRKHAVGLQGARATSGSSA